MQEKELLQLIRKARSKDPDAFSSLIYFYMKDLYRVAISILMTRTQRMRFRIRFLAAGRSCIH